MHPASAGEQGQALGKGDQHRIKSHCQEPVAPGLGGDECGGEQGRHYKGRGRHQHRAAAAPTKCVAQRGSRVTGQRSNG